ncbi:MAG: hypothetical protein ACI81T_003388 [Bacteroidia bacterium]|jgi:hypothetical protein
MAVKTSEVFTAIMNKKVEVRVRKLADLFNYAQ